MNLLELKIKTKEWYQKIDSVYSPALGIKINFNAKGFNHITFRNPRNPRNNVDQINRLKILPLAVKLIEKANIYQEYEYIKPEVLNLKSIEYWGIIAIIDENKIKVILRRIGGGDIHFWSVIPAYSTSEKRDKSFKLKGDPDTD